MIKLCLFIEDSQFVKDCDSASKSCSTSILSGEQRSRDSAYCCILAYRIIVIILEIPDFETREDLMSCLTSCLRIISDYIITLGFKVKEYYDFFYVSGIVQSSYNSVQMFRSTKRNMLFVCKAIRVLNCDLKIACYQSLEHWFTNKFWARKGDQWWYLDFTYGSFGDMCRSLFVSGHKWNLNKDAYARIKKAIPTNEKDLMSFLLALCYDGGQYNISIA